MIPITINGQPSYAENGALLSDLISIAMPCAGKGKCGKCRVLAKGALSSLSDEEKKHLTDEEIAGGVRLACCTRVLGEAEIITIQEGSSKIKTDGIMPSFARKPLFKRLGAAIDIGTTTLAAQLYSEDGLLAQTSMPNPQSAFGADVISRIEKALAGQGAALSKCIANALCEMLRSLTSEDIDTLVITGNTTMLYLLTKQNPEALSHAPFQADRLFGEMITAKEIGLPYENMRVYLPRCMSAFVGADITMALLASDICSGSETALLADIGTNGEIALWHGGALTCCSTAAGPAFEGAGLSMGMAGKSGAIDHVKVKNNALCAHIIDSDIPKCICGSGIIDALACLLKTNQMDETGLLDDDPCTISGAVCVTQQDIRAVQLAKSAVCAGLQTILSMKSIQPPQVKSFVIAGGFGSYLNVESAAKIGLIPPALSPKAHIAGNAALSGAAMLLLNSDFIKKSEALAKSAVTIELSSNAEFMELYVENMMFED